LNMSIGPALPPGFLASKEVDEEEKQAYCPALPPGFSVTKNVDKQSDPLPDIPDKVVGPANMTNTEEGNYSLCSLNSPFGNVGI